MYTRVAKGQGGVEIKGMIELLLAMKDMLHYVKSNERHKTKYLITMLYCVKSGWWGVD